jgi:acyl-CoA hydrolase
MFGDHSGISDKGIHRYSWLKTKLCSDVMYLVTEFGIVNLKGKCVAERAKAIIGLAHPDFREDLERQAYDKRVIPPCVSFCSARNPSEDLQKALHSR